MSKNRILLSGGLGNQLFQYSFAYWISSVTNNTLELDITSYKSDPLRNLELNNLIKLDFECSEMNNLFLRVQKKIQKYINFKNWTIEDPYSPIFKDISEQKDLRRQVFDGYWQDLFFAQFSKSHILNLLEKRDKQYNNLYKKYIDLNQRTTSLHIRRGDYQTSINSQIYVDLFSSGFYQKAIQLNKDCTDLFLIFSDDISWCKQRVDFIPENSVFVDTTTNVVEDFNLMRKCNNKIISNSTLSWWAAFLDESNSPKITAPKKWLHNDHNMTLEHPEHWSLI